MLLVECIKGGVELLMLLCLFDIYSELKKLNNK